MNVNKMSEVYHASLKINGIELISISNGFIIEIV